MKTYYVEWSVEVDAETPEAAAREAVAMHRDPDSIANVFDVIECTETGNGEKVRIDLDELDDYDDLVRHGVERAPRLR